MQCTHGIAETMVLENKQLEISEPQSGNQPTLLIGWTQIISDQIKEKNAPGIPIF